MMTNGVSTGSTIHDGILTGLHRRTVVADLPRPTEHCHHGHVPVSPPNGLDSRRDQCGFGTDATLRAIVVPSAAAVTTTLYGRSTCRSARGSC
jgi:hypothetical protein